MGVHYIVSFSLAQIANITVNFFWHRYITFGVTNESTGRFVKFLSMSIITALFSISLVYIMKEYMLDNIYTIYF